MKINFQVIPRQIGYYGFYYRRILVLKKICLGDSTDWLGHMILLYTNNVFTHKHSKHVQIIFSH